MPKSGADPGFPIGGGASPPGAATYDFAKFCEKLHEIKKILGRGGAHTGVVPPLNRPLHNANILSQNLFLLLFCILT